MTIVVTPLSPQPSPTWAFAARVGGFWARLPIPPSLNNMFHNARGKGKAGRIKTTAYKRWFDQAGWMIKADRSATGCQIYGRFAAVLLISDKESGDADNRFKAIGDLLVSYGVTEDDKKNHAPLTMRSPSIARETCEVIVVPFAVLPELFEFLASLARAAGAGAAGPPAGVTPGRQEASPRAINAT